MDVSSTTLFIWTVRIALPLVFFLLWWRQPKDQGQTWVDTGPQTGRHGRSALLEVRRAVRACAAPGALATVKLVEDTTRPAGRGSAPRAPVRRERGERGARERRAPGSGKRDKVTKVVTGLEPNLSDEDRKHLESLLNYVAFNRKQQEEKALGIITPSSPVRTAAAEPATAAAKANLEAQSVLKGSVNQQLGETSAVVAKDLFKKLSDDGIEVEESTFSLMIQACLYAGDLKGASDFLMQMETVGMCPDSSVLDQVMSLYTQYKVYGYDAPGEGTDYGYWGAEVAPEAQQMWSAAWVPDATSAAATPTDVGTSKGKPGAKSSFNFDAYSDDDDDE